MEKVREALERIESQALAAPLARDQFELIDMLQNVYDIASKALSALPAPESGCEAAVLAERERAAGIAEKYAAQNFAQAQRAKSRAAKLRKFSGAFGTDALEETSEIGALECEAAANEALAIAAAIRADRREG